MAGQFLIRDASQGQWLALSDPVKIYQIDQHDQVIPTLQEIEAQTSKQRLWAMGWLSYEASSVFDSALETQPASEFPLLWFGLFRSCEVVDLTAAVEAFGASSYGQTRWSLNSTRAQYRRKIAQIKQEIKDGNTYQVNYTIRQYADLDVPAEDAFFGFAANAKYGALIDAGRYAVCSASPELFFEVNQNQIRTKPMKGTAPRGLTLAEDLRLAEELKHSAKNRAENLMIVDMIRNDLGRIAEAGTVAVPKLFELEKYPTLWQMTSTVTAKINCGLVEILTALFPCASITGAPKANTMKIISRLETSARNIYTGTIGLIRPDQSMQFNVAIRTVLLDKQYAQAEYGVGGGIVWDSTADSEFEECLTKSKVLSTKLSQTPALLETLLWTKDEGFFLFDYHLARLQASAEYFNYPVDLIRLKKQLEAALSEHQYDQRVRLLLDQNGESKIEMTTILASNCAANYRVKLADQPVSKANVFLHHKTTERQVYDYFKQRFVEYDDVLLFNEDGEITESCIANLVLEKDAKRFTPPISCGLLNGTYRQYLLEKGEILERRISKTDLAGADRLYLINSVRKMWPIELEL